MLNSTNHQQLTENGNSNCNRNSNSNSNNSTTTSTATTTTITNSSSSNTPPVSVRRRHNKRKSLLSHFSCSKSSSSSFSLPSTASSEDSERGEAELATESEMEVKVLNLSHRQKDHQHDGNNYVTASIVTSMLTDAAWLQFYDDVLQRLQHNSVATAANAATTNSILQNAEVVKQLQDIFERSAKNEQPTKQRKPISKGIMPQEMKHNLLDEKSFYLTEIKVEEPTISGGDNSADNDKNKSSNSDKATAVRNRLKRSANKFKSKSKRPKAHDDDNTETKDGIKLRNETESEDDEAENIKLAAESQSFDDIALQQRGVSSVFQEQCCTDAESAYSDSSCAGSSRADSLCNVAADFDSAVLNQDNIDTAADITGAQEQVAIVKKEPHNVKGDFYQHLIKCTSYLECKNDTCRLKNLRDHLHCYELPCLGKALCRKDDFVRHIKWHRKRNESLNYGLLRYSANDDCTQIAVGIGDEDAASHHQPTWTTCKYNRKQTHYHCAQLHCARVYVSTSDAQMHANYHKKANAIKREGFQRFRAKDDCKTEFCMFTGQQTTHFHCCRANCQFTFKHKADMEKHKAYHLKDLELARDGFKRYLKNERCPYPLCRFLGVCNHIHCARDNCCYVLHSSGQMLSHKRKHERIESDLANNRYMLLRIKLAALLAAATTAATAAVNGEEATMPNDNNLLTTVPAKGSEVNVTTAPATLERFQKLLQQQQVQNLWPVELSLNAATAATYALTTPTATTAVAGSATIPTANADATAPMQITTIDGFFNRKRGRPPKNRFVEVYKNTQPTPQAIFTSFKLEKQSNNNNNSRSSTLSPINEKSSTASADATKRTDFKEKQSRQQQQLKQKHSIILSHDTECSGGSENVQTYQQQQKHQSATTTTTTPTKTHVICKQQQHSIDNKNTTSPAYRTNSDNESYSPVAATPTCVFTPPPSCATCPLMQQHHYHCRCDDDQCSYVTKSRDALSLHMEHLHTTSRFADTINRRYTRYDRAIGLDCGITKCRLRKTRPHLHCKKCLHKISPFDLESHECAAAGTAPESLATTSVSPMQIQLESFCDMSKPTTFVRAAGTFYPENSISSNSNCDNSSSIRAAQTEDGTTCNRPFCKMKRKPHAHCEICAQAFASAQKALLHRQKQHYASSLCSADIPQDLSITPKNNTRTNRCRKHASTVSSPPTVPPIPMSSQLCFTTSQAVSPATNLNKLTPFVSYYQQPPQQQFFAIPTPAFSAAIHSQLYPFSQALPESTKTFLGVPGVSGDINNTAVSLPTSTRQEMLGIFSNNIRATIELSTQSQLQQPGNRPSTQPPSFKLKDDRIPLGYLKFRFNEDCCFPKCGYRNHQSHFHCDRSDCHYSFCDKTRFVQHTARHNRLDTLMGEDFRQYRANMNCGYENCAYFKNLGSSNKSSHFHCLKCAFICSDTNKVVAHRRQHSKMEYIRLAGFRKVASNESCNFDNISNSKFENLSAMMEPACVHSMKQTHYHCLVCDCSVLSRAQLTSHRHKVINISTTTTVTTTSLT